jgi:hypothetical protein
MRKGVVSLIVLAGLALAGCSSSRVDPDIDASDSLATAPEPQPMPSQQPLPTGPLTAAQVNSTLSERTFAYEAPGRSGQVTYYGDGTFSYQETGKGAGTGSWQGADGKLCEAYNPTNFLPKGTPSTCQPISSDGSQLRAGQMVLRPS